MKKRFSLTAAILLFFCSLSFALEVDHMDPPFWYTGMKNPQLQVMLHGKDISKADFSLKDYPGVSVKEVSKLSNPNYLIVYLDVDSLAKPGILTFNLKEGKKTKEIPFELRARDNKTRAQGFTPADVLYLIMPDRFANGNPDNDNLGEWIADRSKGGHHGGDLQGIKDHLDYIDELGVTAIWLNPVQFNKGNASHGYAISDYYLIDPRLGTNEEYCELIESAHDKNIKVVMDMIFNHSGSSHWWLEDVPDSTWFNQNNHAENIRNRDADRRKRQEGQQPSPEQVLMYQQMRRNNDNLFPATIEEYYALPQEKKEEILARVVRNPEALVTNNHYKWVLMDPHAPQSEKDVLLEGWFSGGMPDLNQRHRHLADYLIQNSIWWIEYAGIDGIRMDTYPYADYEFMQRWCDEVVSEYPDFNIVGEGWYPRNSAAAWWQKGSSVNDNDSRLKTVMDFDLTFTTQNEITKESNTREGSEAGLFKMYEVITQDFLFPDSDYILTFLDNHDIARFMQPGDPAWKLKQGVAFLLTTRGIPQIYYGTEIGMPGPDMRADFPGGWAEDEMNAFTPEGRDEFQNEVWDFTSKLLNWRRGSKAVKEGKLVHYTPDNTTKCYVYARTNGQDTVLVILNGSDTVRLLDMNRFAEVIRYNKKGTDAVTGEIIDITQPVVVPPRGVYVLDLSE